MRKAEIKGLQEQASSHYAAARDNIGYGFTYAAARAQAEGAYYSKRAREILEEGMRRKARKEFGAAMDAAYLD